MTSFTTLSPMTASEAVEVIKVPLGRSRADLAILNATIANVYTGELLSGYSVCTKGRWIAYVGANPDGTLGPETKVIDAQGKTVIPGLIDGHTHIAYITRPDEFLKYVMKGGTTTLVTEGMEPYPVAGYDGLVDFLESVKDQPIKIFATAPAMVSMSRAFQGLPLEELKALLEKEQIVGIGESYWQAVIQEPEVYLPAFAEARRARKTLEGHSAGASEKKLAAYTAAGVTSCHEPIKWEEALERMRLGMHAMAREGGVRRDLEEIAKVKDEGVDLRRFTIVTDSIGPEELLEMGYMEHVLQKAIDCGFDPVSAVQMTTLNAAEHFHLDNLVGGIAPGRFADLVVVPDIKRIEAEYVISNGKIIARDGELLVEPRSHTYSPPSLHTVNLPRGFEASDFAIPVEPGKTKALVRVIEMLTPLVNAESHIELPVAEGEIKLDLDRDIIKVAAIDRRNTPGKTFTGLIKGFHLTSGAVACTASWDTSDIIVVGADEEAMADAVNRIHDLQGGIAIWNKGEVVQEIPMRIFGVISELPLKELALKLKEIKESFSTLGVPHPDPVLSLITLTCAAIPYLRICEEGLVNLKDGRTMGLFVD